MFQERIIAQIGQSEPITNKICGGRGSDPLVIAPLSSLSPSPFSLFTFSLYLGKKTPNNKTPLQHGDNSGGVTVVTISLPLLFPFPLFSRSLSS
ncbi:hypothetical protein Hanom_Chr10g00875751 [Helianthus anomalus]